MKYYLWYSEAAIAQWGSFIYKLPDNTHIEVSGITHTTGYDWDDLNLIGIYSGEGLEFVGVGKKPYSLSFSAEVFLPNKYKDWIEKKGVFS